MGKPLCGTARLLLVLLAIGVLAAPARAQYEQTPVLPDQEPPSLPPPPTLPAPPEIANRPAPPSVTVAPPRLPEPPTEPAVPWEHDCISLSLLELIHLGVGGGYVLFNTRAAAPITPLYIDVGTGLHCYRSPRKDPKAFGFVYMPKLGYSFGVANGESTHLGNVGVGLGVGNNLVNILYMPRFVVGTRSGELASGFRHGLQMHFFYDLLGFDISHQVLWTRDAHGAYVEHDVRGLLSLNAAAAVALIAVLAK